MKRAANLVDGDIGTMWTPGVWIEQNYWAVLDMGESVVVDRIRQWHRQQWDTEVGIKEIYVSDNPDDFGESLGNLRQIHNEEAGWKEADIEDTKGRYIKLVSDICRSPNWREIGIGVK